MTREQVGCRPGHDRRGERRSRQLDVAGRDYVVGLLHRERRRRRNRAHHVAAGRRQLRLREAVFRVAVRRPRRGRVVADGELSTEVDGADGHHERIVTRCVENAARPCRVAVVACGRDDEDAVEPELLDRVVERVVVEVVLRGGVEREVSDADIELRLVGEDVVACRDHVARACLPAVVHDVDRQDPGIRRSTGVARCRPDSDAGDEGSVPAAVTG